MAEFKSIPSTNANQTNKAALKLEQVIDTDKYPILGADLHSDKCKAVLQECHAKLQLDGSCVIPGFIRKDVIARMVSEVSNIEGAYHRNEPMCAFAGKMHTKKIPDDADENHPYVKKHPQSVRAVANDLIPQDTLLRQVYQSDEVKKFLASIVQLPNLYAYNDEFQSLNVMYLSEGDQRTWHYDGSDFVVTLSLQRAEKGGRFEFAPFSRHRDQIINEFNECDDEHFDDIEAITRADGSYKGEMKILTASPGDIVVFNGMRSLHHVTPVEGKTTRINAVMSYDTRPTEEQTFSRNVGVDGVNVMLYGDRVREIYRKRLEMD